MEFGIFTNMYHPKHWRDGRVRTEHETLKNELEYIQIADRTGFKYSWSAEHHFLDEYSHLSAAESFMAYAIAKTERIHVGHADCAYLDHLGCGAPEMNQSLPLSATIIP